MEIFIGWILFSIVAAIIASAKGRSGAGYFFLSIILSPLIGVILAAALPSLIAPKFEQATPTPTPETHVKCPDCRELVLIDARKCKHCGCALTPEPEASEEQLMAKYGIHKDGIIYHYKEWRYDKLSDAIAQANKG